MHSEWLTRIMQVMSSSSGIIIPHRAVLPYDAVIELCVVFNLYQNVYEGGDMYHQMYRFTAT